MSVPVCVFAKPPIAGQVKTRLSRRVGAEAAAALARAFFLDTWEMVSRLAWARPVLASAPGDIAAFGLGAARDRGVEIWPQGPGDLGARMERVLERGIAEAGLAILVGADLPGLPAAHLDAARAALDGHDVVLGRASDGGFWVIGASRLPARALADLPWSTPSTLTATEQRLASLGLAVSRAPAFHDIDEADDLGDLRRRLAAAPASAPRTWAALGGAP